MPKQLPNPLNPASYAKRIVPPPSLDELRGLLSGFPKFQAMLDAHSPASTGEPSPVSPLGNGLLTSFSVDQCQTWRAAKNDTSTYWDLSLFGGSVTMTFDAAAGQFWLFELQCACDRLTTTIGQPGSGPSDLAFTTIRSPYAGSLHALVPFDVPTTGPWQLVCRSQSNLTPYSIRVTRYGDAPVANPTKPIGGAGAVKGTAKLPADKAKVDPSVLKLGAPGSLTSQRRVTLLDPLGSGALRELTLLRGNPVSCSAAKSSATLLSPSANELAAIGMTLNIEPANTYVLEVAVDFPQGRATAFKSRLAAGQVPVSEVRDLAVQSGRFQLALPQGCTNAFIEPQDPSVQFTFNECTVRGFA